MTLEKPIYFVMVEFSRLFPSRTEVLHHLFYVDGNGYEWKNGELTDGENSKYPKFYNLNANREKPDENQKRRDAVYKKISDFFKKNPDVCSIHTTHLSSIYPICQYAKILNLPLDIKDDWIDGAREALFAVKMHIYNKTCKKVPDENIDLVETYFQTRLEEIQNYRNEISF